MRTAKLAFLTTVLLGSAAAADPVFGTWGLNADNPREAVHVRVYGCEDKVCGVLARVPEGEDTSDVGKRMIWDMQPNGSGTYSGGRVWAADQDRIYRGKLELAGDSLKISGCVLGGTVCRGETFQRLR